MIKLRMLAFATAAGALIGAGALAQNDTTSNQTTNGGPIGTYNGNETMGTGGQAGAYTGNTTPNTSGVQSAGVPAAADSREFVTMAGISDTFEIQSSQLALQRSQNAQVRAFAQQMINDHTRTSAELKAAATADGLPPPPQTLDARHQEMLTQLQGTPARDFDDKYIDIQTAAHNEAVALFQAQAGRDEGGQVTAFAKRTLPALQMHLDHVRKLDAAD